MLNENNLNVMSMNFAYDESMAREEFIHIHTFQKASLLKLRGYNSAMDYNYQQVSTH